MVGVDLGSSKVAVVVAEYSPLSKSGNLEILGFSEVKLIKEAIRNGFVENFMQVGSAVKTALESAVALSPDIEIGNVNVSFGGTHVVAAELNDGSIRATSATSEVVTQKDVDQLIRDIYLSKKESHREIMHVFPKHFIVDNLKKVWHPVGRRGIKLGGDFVIVSADSQSIENAEKSIELADSEVEIDRMMLAPLAAGLAVLDEEEKKAGVVLVDIGESTTDIVIYQEGIVKYTASLPVAGRHITMDLRSGCGIQLPHAEMLKKEYGTALSEEVPMNIEILVNHLPRHKPRQILKKNVALIIEERLKEIAALVYAEILKSGLAHELIGGIVLTGGTANISEIETIFSRVSEGMPVRVGIPEGLERTSKADAVSNTSYATALGLVWAGIKTMDSRVNSVFRIRENAPKVPKETVKKQEEPVPAAPSVRGILRDLFKPGSRDADEY